MGRWNLLSAALARRGHFSASYAAYPQLPLRLPFNVSYQMSLFGGVPTDSADFAFERALALEPITGRTPLRRALLWWLQQRDTVSLVRFAQRSDSAATTARNADRRILLRGTGEARAYLALVRGDSATALRRLQSLDDSVCVVVACDRSALVQARLLAALGQPQEAAALLDRYFQYSTEPLGVAALLARARLAERLGERARAVQAYRFVLATWQHADPALQPHVAEARAALVRLDALGAVASH